MWSHLLLQQASSKPLIKTKTVVQSTVFYKMENDFTTSAQNGCHAKLTAQQGMRTLRMTCLDFQKLSFIEQLSQQFCVVLLSNIAVGSFLQRILYLWMAMISWQAQVTSYVWVFFSRRMVDMSLRWEQKVKESKTKKFWVCYSCLHMLRKSLCISLFSALYMLKSIIHLY